MRRIVIAVVLLGALAWLTPSRDKGVILVEAQTLPLTKTFAWDDDATADPATSHNVTLDGVSVGMPTGTTQSVTFTTLGIHTLTVTETNIWGTSPSSTLVVNVRAPGAPKNQRIQ